MTVTDPVNDETEHVLTPVAASEGQLCHVADSFIDTRALPPSAADPSGENVSARFMDIGDEVSGPPVVLEHVKANEERVSPTAESVVDDHRSTSSFPGHETPARFSDLDNTFAGDGVMLISTTTEGEDTSVTSVPYHTPSPSEDRSSAEFMDVDDGMSGFSTALEYVRDGRQSVSAVESVDDRTSGPSSSCYYHVPTRFADLDDHLPDDDSVPTPTTANKGEETSGKSMAHPTPPLPNGEAPAKFMDIDIDVGRSRLVLSPASGNEGPPVSAAGCVVDHHTTSLLLSHRVPAQFTDLDDTMDEDVVLLSATMSGGLLPSAVDNPDGPALSPSDKGIPDVSMDISDELEGFDVGHARFLSLESRDSSSPVCVFFFGITPISQFRLLRSGQTAILEYLFPETTTGKCRSGHLLKQQLATNVIAPGNRHRFGKPSLFSFLLV